MDRLKQPHLKDINYKNFKVTKVEEFVQDFPELCLYSCSKSNEIRTFSLFRNYYRINIFRFSFKTYQSVRVVCKNCNWQATLPVSFAKKAFKKGLESHLLIRFAKNKIVTSRFLNFYGSFWRIWIITLGILISVTMIRYYFDPVQTTTPEELSYSNAFSRENIGKIVKLSGNVDYTLALLKETQIENGSQTLKREVYLPLFDRRGGEDFILIKGGEEDVKKVLSFSGKDTEDIQKQPYTISGELELIDTVTNRELVTFFVNELPGRRNLNTPELVINSADIKTLPEFYNSFAYYYYVIILLLISSTIVQFYIDKQLYHKSR